MTGGASKEKDVVAILDGDPAVRKGATTLKNHFDRAVALLEARAAALADLKAWRADARGDGLDPAALVRLAREHLLDADQRRKAAERAEVEELYRQTLGLPLFDHARAAE
jgi:uncharacterized protein (UPF0335 family)